MKVLKFGGSSVANAASIKSLTKIVVNTASENPAWIVVSASGKTTNNLIKLSKLALTTDQSFDEELKKIEQHHLILIKELIETANQSSIIAIIKNKINELEQILNSVRWLNDLSPKTKDKIVSFGEIMSAQIIHAVLNQEAISCAYQDSRTLIKTDSNFTAAKVDFKKTSTLVREFQANNKNDITVLGGFISSDTNNQTTTLGRGGSDYTAAIIAAILNVAVLEIWTDVSGLYTANPNLVSQASPITSISYEEALELSHFGATVIYPPTILPVLEKNIPIKIKNTFQPNDFGH